MKSFVKSWQVTVKPDSDHTCVPLQVQCITEHPTYNPRDKPMDNDFAIITLEDPLDLVNGVIRAACLPDLYPPPTYVVDETMFTVSGWGLMEEGGEDQPQVLHHVQVPFYNRSVVAIVYYYIVCKLAFSYTCSLWPM